MPPPIYMRTAPWLQHTAPFMAAPAVAEAHTLGPSYRTVASSWSPTRPQPQQKPAVQSRYTNSMFQRQLSTNALSTGPPSQSGQAGSSSSTGTATPVASAAKPGAPHATRLFQRQMTASQLFSTSSSSAATAGTAASSTAAASSTSGGQFDKKRLMAGARADLELARSAANLTTAAMAQQGSSGVRAASARAIDDGASVTKKPTKNKRIISRMLSISAIHTSVGATSDSGPSSLIGAGSDHHHHHHQQSDETTAGNTGGGGTSIDGQRNTDKFDSSFRRSRSSSTSSTTGQHAGQEAHASAGAAASESIRCIAFVDATNQAALGSTSGASAAGSQSGASGSPAGVGGGGGGIGGTTSGAAMPVGQVQSSAGANHKSLSPIDAGQQGAPQLALWLGTSTGSVLLVGLQMPDTEDNRVLQLQSVNAEPIPQASVKLPSQILALTTFTCEARPLVSGGAGAGGAAQALAAGGNSGGAGAQSASQSSSLEGDTLMQSPSSSGSSNSASGAAGGALGATGSCSSSSGVAPSGGGGGSSGGHSARLFQGADSLDARSSIFFAVVSEKQARIYQVPANLSASLTGAAQSGPAGGRDHQHHHSTSSHGHHHTSSSSPSSLSSMPLADSPLAHLLVNKRNLIAECELSESSFACRSQIVQMRSPDESCLVSYLANGNLTVHALPRLKPILMDADFVPYTHSRIAHSMRLSRNGHCLYQPSSSELSKFTISSQYNSMVNEMSGLVWVPREMPEMPRTNFFKSLFSVSQSAKQTDRDELFGECSAGKPVRGVAKHSGGSQQQQQQQSGLDKLKGAAAGTMGHDLRLAREGLDERGEKLSEIEDRTLNMMNSAESYSQAAHQLAQKFKDKKWYQF